MRKLSKPPVLAYEPIAETVREVTKFLAIRCETRQHEYVRGRCAWCGREQEPVLQ
jgi:hypothetical protein